MPKNITMKTTKLEIGGRMPNELDILQMEERHKRDTKNTTIIGVPYYKSIYGSMSSLTGKQKFIIYEGARSSGKTVFLKNLEFAYKESLITGIPFELILEKNKEGIIKRIKAINRRIAFESITQQEPYEPMKPLTMSYKERFRLQRLKTINNQ